MGARLIFINMENITIKKNDAGQRLDKFLSKAVKTLPFSMMYKAIRTKKIKVNRKRTEPNYMLKEGDEIQLFLKPEFFEGTTDESTNALASIKPKLDIVYEDDNLILLNKRPGVLVHEDKEGGENTLVTHLQAYLYQKGEYDPDEEQSFAPALCNRIDRNTGGMVIAAKTAESLRVINEAIRSDWTHKFYYCVVHGKMQKKADVLRAYLKKNADDNLVTISDVKKDGYKEIITKYRVVKEHPKFSLLEIELVTGRTHQIRAQMAHIGHPLLGDGKYGVNRADKQKGYKFQALYAYKLQFDLPESSVLDTVNHKTFTIDEDKIWFIKDYETLIK